MRYSFEDKDPGLKPGVPEIITVVQIVKVTEVIEVDEFVTEEFDLTWVYIFAGCAAFLTIIVVVCLCKYCKLQKAIRLQAMEERKPGYERDAMFLKRPNSVQPKAGANLAGPEVLVNNVD